MLIQPFDMFVHVWLITAALSAGYVAWDLFTANPEPSVMKWGFVLVTLYMGPIGLLLYVMADKELGREPTSNSSRRFGSRAWVRRFIVSLEMQLALLRPRSSRLWSDYRYGPTSSSNTPRVSCSDCPCSRPCSCAR